MFTQMFHQNQNLTLRRRLCCSLADTADLTTHAKANNNPRPTGRCQMCPGDGGREGMKVF